MSGQTRLVEVRQKVLKQNDIVARALRQRFRAAGVYVFSLVSSPGSGKTAFLEQTLTSLEQADLDQSHGPGRIRERARHDRSPPAAADRLRARCPPDRPAS